MDALDQTVELIEGNPRAGAALLLYGLVKTLSTEQGGYVYLLKKLREMDEDSRRLAYGLMELMARGENERPRWAESVARMDKAFRGY